MIVVKVMAGLGNQMFQYAAGRTLALKNKSDLYLDTGWFEGQKALGDSSRPYELGAFNLPAKIAPKKIRRAVFLAESSPTPISIKTKMARITWGSLPQLSVLRQTGLGVDSNFFKAGDNTLLIGWWQSQKYFAQIEKTIKKDFSFKKFSDHHSIDLATRIEDSSSVALHVRRGDYITNPDAAKKHGLTGLDFYLAADRMIAAKVMDPTFYVFSDDIKWCKKNLKLGHPTVFIDHTSSSDEDMHLMSLCKHNIIANSSFSWWAAWLNKNSDKMIIAPKVWFQDKEENEETDNMPKGWIQI